MLKTSLGLVLAGAALLGQSAGCRGTSAESDSPYRQVRIAGLPASARVDPDSGAIAWRALTCMNPACRARGCEGEAFLFASVTPGAAVSDQGAVVIPAAKSAEYEVPLPRCPVCGATGEAVVFYDPPDLRLRLMQLQTELEDARRARGAAEATGRLSGNLRTPAEIMKEMSDLPRVYLIPE